MTLKMMVGDVVVRGPLETPRTYKVVGIVRDANKSCTGGALHRVDLVEVATGGTAYLYATDDMV